MEEKKLFGGLVFMVNGKMCVNISGQNLMCRVDPSVHEELVQKKGCTTVIMKGREYKGYVDVQPEAFGRQEDFEYWVNLCLDFNKKAKMTKKRK
ncbi:MAG: TfoX/Sxy family protein [Terriglobia bacterium]